MKTNPTKLNCGSEFVVRRSISKDLSLLLLLAAVSAAFGQPIITQQPQNQMNFPGATVIFWVSAIGNPALAYQWQKQGAD